MTETEKERERGVGCGVKLGEGGGVSQQCYQPEILIKSGQLSTLPRTPADGTHRRFHFGQH